MMKRRSFLMMAGSVFLVPAKGIAQVPLPDLEPCGDPNGILCRQQYEANRRQRDQYVEYYENTLLPEQKRLIAEYSHYDNYFSAHPRSGREKVIDADLFVSNERRLSARVVPVTPFTGAKQDRATCTLWRKNGLGRYEREVRDTDRFDLVLSVDDTSDYRFWNYSTTCMVFWEMSFVDREPPGIEAGCVPPPQTVEEAQARGCP